MNEEEIINSILLELKKYDNNKDEILIERIKNNILSKHQNQLTEDSVELIKSGISLIKPED